MPEIEFTVREAIEASVPLRKLGSSEDMPFGARLNLTKLIQQLQPVTAEFEKERALLQKTYGMKNGRIVDEKGQPDLEKMQQYETEVEEVLGHRVTITAPHIKMEVLSTLGVTKLTAIDLAQLAPFLDTMEWEPGPEVRSVVNTK